MAYLKLQFKIRMPFYTLLVSLFSLIGLCSGGIWKSADPYTYPVDYGVDISFPIHHYQQDDTVFRDRYKKLMAGCYSSASAAQCDGTERARLEMNMHQPATQHNYTEIGFKKMKLPDVVFKPLLEFFENNKDKEKKEAWQPGNTYVNHWDTPPYMVR